MKILQVHNYYQYAGGEDRVIDDERELLTSNGHEVYRFTKTYDDLKKLSSYQLAKNAIWSRHTARNYRYAWRNISLMWCTFIIRNH